MTATKIDDLPTVYDAKETEERIILWTGDSHENQEDTVRK